MTNFTAPPPAKKANTASGFFSAIWVRIRLELDLRERHPKLADDLSAGLAKAFLEGAVTSSSPAAYFQVMVIAVLWPASAMTLPIG